MVEFACLSSKRAGIVTRWGYQFTAISSMFGKDRMFSTSKARFDSRVSPPISSVFMQTVTFAD